MCVVSGLPIANYFSACKLVHLLENVPGLRHDAEKGGDIQSHATLCVCMYVCMHVYIIHTVIFHSLCMSLF